MKTFEEFAKPYLIIKPSMAKYLCSKSNFPNPSHSLRDEKVKRRIKETLNLTDVIEGYQKAIKNCNLYFSPEYLKFDKNNLVLNSIVEESKNNDNDNKKFIRVFLKQISNKYFNIKRAKGLEINIFEKPKNYLNTDGYKFDNLSCFGYAVDAVKGDEYVIPMRIKLSGKYCSYNPYETTFKINNCTFIGKKQRTDGFKSAFEDIFFADYSRCISFIFEQYVSIIDDAEEDAYSRRVHYEKIQKLSTQAKEAFGVYNRLSDEFNCYSLDIQDVFYSFDERYGVKEHVSTPFGTLPEWFLDLWNNLDFEQKEFLTTLDCYKFEISNLFKIKTILNQYLNKFTSNT